jgi:hypothetical protein
MQQKIINLPDSAYELSSTELKYLILQPKEKPLMTQKMRDLVEFEKQSKYPTTTIKIKLPDYSIMQINFRSCEKVSMLFNEVEKIVAFNGGWKLYTSPPTKDLDSMKTFWQHGLAPASLVYFAPKVVGQG